MVGVAVPLELEPGPGNLQGGRIALGVAAPRPSARPSQKRLVGKRITAGLLDRVGDDSCEETLCRIRSGGGLVPGGNHRVMAAHGLLALERARQRFGR